MNVKKILTGWLKENGYDGLYNLRDIECACNLEEICHCEGDMTGCEPGYQVPSDEYGYSIVPEKPKGPPTDTQR